MKAFAFLVVPLFIVTAVAETATSKVDPGSSDYHKDALNYHNERRKEHQVGPLELNEDLTTKAEKCAKYYVTERRGIDHSCPHRGSVGENLYVIATDKKELSEMAQDASKRWYDEVNHYKYDSTSCVSSNVCHFTAMVWKGTTKLGVGAYKADGLGVVVALYSPRPNTKNKYKDNVLPKK